MMTEDHVPHRPRPPRYGRAAWVLGGAWALGACLSPLGEPSPVAGDEAGSESSGAAPSTMHDASTSLATGEVEATSAELPSEDGSDTSRSSDEPELPMECDDPWVLGDADLEAQLEPQIVWTGSAYIVGWVGPRGYELRRMEQRTIASSASLEGRNPGMTRSDPPPQLLWTGTRLELYYARTVQGADSYEQYDLWRDVFDSDLNVTESAVVQEDAGYFRAVQVGPDRIAVRGQWSLLLDGQIHETFSFRAHTLGWNGTSFVASDVLGHGSWHFQAFDLEGTHVTDPLMHEWQGSGGTGSGAGSALASSAETGRHAAATAGYGQLRIEVEGEPLYEAALMAEEADVSMFWDGQRYVVLLADGAYADGVGARDILLLPVTASGEAPDLAHATVVSAVPADERFPVGAAGDSSEYGMAWMRGPDVVFAHCG